MTTRWWLIRHAPVPEPGSAIQGQLDPDADCTDADALAALAARLPEPAVWLVSPLRRCRQTAQALAAHRAGLPPEPIAVPELMEQHFGRWQGQTHAALNAAGALGVREFWADPAYRRPPGGESFAELAARVGRVLVERSHAHAGSDVVAVCHAGPIRAALALALGLSPERALSFVIDPLSLTRIDHIAHDAAPAAWRIGTVNRPAR